MFIVMDKRTGKPVEVYGVTKDAHGYPHFVIRENKQWLTVSAKHYIPWEEATFDGL